MDQYYQISKYLNSSNIFRSHLEMTELLINIKKVSSWRFQTIYEDLTTKTTKANNRISGKKWKIETSRLKIKQFLFRDYNLFQTAGLWYWCWRLKRMVWKTTYLQEKESIYKNSEHIYYIFKLEKLIAQFSCHHVISCQNFELSPICKSFLDQDLLSLISTLKAA